MYVLPVLYSCRAVAVPLHSVYRACTFYPFLYSCRALTIAQSARVMYVLPVLYSWRAVAVPLHRVLYSHRTLTYCTVSTGNVRFTRFVLVPCCDCTIASCVGNVPFTRFLYSCRACTLHSASTGHVLIDRVRTRAVAVPLHGVYRACTVISSHSCWTSSSLNGLAIPFLGLGVEFVYQRFNCSPLVGHFSFFFWKNKIYLYIYIYIYNKYL